MALTHTPVMLEEVLRTLSLRSGDVVVDGTVGLGGHAAAVAACLAPHGCLIGIDRDPRNLACARERLTGLLPCMHLVQDSYAHVAEICSKRGFSSIDAALLDLGYSSAHVEDASRGFSFQLEGPLDMRYDPSQVLRAEEIVNMWTEEELARVFRIYGEEMLASRAASAIVRARRANPLTTTTELAHLLSSVLPHRGRIHPATRVFQALRIAVNDELGELERAIPHFLGLLKPGGRFAIITFHSLEDRIVKKAFAAASEEGKGRPLTKHVIKPTRQETLENPRARSAKLRVFVTYDHATASSTDALHSLDLRTHELDQRSVVCAGGVSRRVLSGTDHAVRKHGVSSLGSAKSHRGTVAGKSGIGKSRRGKSRDV